MSELVEIDKFAPHEGSRFRIALDGETDQPDSLELELIEVRSLKLEDENRDPALRSEPFRLTFRGGPKDAYLPQASYTLEHDDLGNVDIFLVPIGPDDQAMRYEAIFN
jgi:hypothetical protein